MRTSLALGLALAVASPGLAGTVAASSNGLVSTMYSLWGVVQALAYPVACLGLTLGLGALYAQHHDFKAIGHGVINGGLLGGGVITAAGILGAVTGTSGALI